MLSVQHTRFGGKIYSSIGATGTTQIDPKVVQALNTWLETNKATLEKDGLDYTVQLSEMTDSAFDRNRPTFPGAVVYAPKLNGHVVKFRDGLLRKWESVDGFMKRVVKLAHRQAKKSAKLS